MTVSLEKTTAQDVMSKDVVSIHPQEHVHEALQLMAEINPMEKRSISRVLSSAEPGSSRLLTKALTPRINGIKKPGSSHSTHFGAYRSTSPRQFQ